jgi:iron only hydrogenase large subunit-like protein
LLAPNLIKATGEGEKKIAKVSLSDCLACSGCVTSAETVLIQQQSVEQVKVRIERNTSCLFTVIADSYS